MGGGSFDSVMRGACTILSLVIFGFVAFFFVTVWRVELGDLHMCFSEKDQEIPVTHENDLLPNAVNVSKMWSILFWCCFGAQVVSLLQVIFSKIAYNTHESTIFDKCLTPFVTIVNIIV